MEICQIKVKLFYLGDLLHVNWQFGFSITNKDKVFLGGIIKWKCSFKQDWDKQNYEMIVWCVTECKKDMEH